MSNVAMYLRNRIKLTPPFRYLRRKRFNAELGNRKNAELATEMFRDHLPSQIDHDSLIKDMIRMSKDYRYKYDEYFLYHFAEKSDDERLLFVADLDRIDVVETMNKAANEPLFDDKSRTYKKYKKYYGRELLACGGVLRSFRNLDRFFRKRRGFLSNLRIVAVETAPRF